MKLKCKNNKIIKGLKKSFFGKEDQEIEYFDLIIGSVYQIDFSNYASYGNYYYSAYIKGENGVFSIDVDSKKELLEKINTLFE